MFDSLSTKLESTFKKLRSFGKLTERDIDETLKEIRSSLLEADVNFQVVKKFCDTVRSRSLGKEVQKSLTPGETIIKFVHEELVNSMGKREQIDFHHAPPVIILVVGLQGSGKTTSCAKLAKYLRDELKRRPLLLSVDVYRPAAIEQLQTLGARLQIEVFPSTIDDKPVALVEAATDYAKNSAYDTLIIDTAGRLQIDNALMDELVEIVEAIEPHEILLVADAMTGQEAVNVAKGFDECLDIDGLVLTKLDGDARGGAALSMRAVTGKPIKFIGIGEKLEALEVFHPDRMASRILGMGDVLTFIEKASKQISFEDSKKLQKKFKKNEFSLEDYYDQIQSIKKMGSMGSLLKMIPGMASVARGVDESAAEGELRRVEAMILSMTPDERRDHTIIDGSRRARIARGSGTSVEHVNKLLKQFSDIKKVMKRFSKMSPSAISGLAGMMKGAHKPI